MGHHLWQSILVCRYCMSVQRLYGCINAASAPMPCFLKFHLPVVCIIFPSLWLLSKDTTVNPFPNKPWFLRVDRMSLLKTLQVKEKLLVKNNFSFSHSVFYCFRELSIIFIQVEIVVCKLFYIGRV